jgi:Copper binding proteins, plastocyanin/azurin family.
VILSDMGGGMMGGGRMMNVTATPSTVSPGEVSFRVWNESVMMVHELVVLPLGPGTVGSRPIGSDGQVSETDSLGEASNACGQGAGEGIPPGSASWVTLHLDPDRYELICNLPGHYARGMYTELDVQ